MAEKHYKGNPNLKAENVQIEFTTDQVQEYLRCKQDPVYFAVNYIKIVSLVSIENNSLTKKYNHHHNLLIDRFHCL